MLKVTSDQIEHIEKIYSVYLSKDEYEIEINRFKKEGQKPKSTKVGTVEPWKLKAWESLGAIRKRENGEYVITMNTPVGHIYKSGILRSCIYGSINELMKEKCNIDYTPLMYQIVRYWDDPTNK